jgi:AmmeMemoRadiSam system protein B
VNNLVLRKAAVAGSFYPRYKPDLIRTIESSFLDKEFGPGTLFEHSSEGSRTILGGICPHAGYTYSGCCAAYTYLNIFKEKTPDVVIILGTDHVGLGKIALLEEGEWETPLGNLEIDSELTKLILKSTKKIVADDSAFIGYPFGREHNIEVQLPFIKYCSKKKSTKIVPITISNYDYEFLEEISKDLAKVIQSSTKDIVIIASSDMTHREPRNIMNPQNDIQEMKNVDNDVINAFKEFNPLKAFQNARKTTVCGPQTIATLMLTCQKMNAKTCEHLKYYTSYEKGGGTGPCEYSVGYFSGIIRK